jgi:enoyl-CoA hydratase
MAGMLKGTLSLRMPFSTLLFEVADDGVAVVTVNRPDKLNALNAAVLADLAEAARQIATDNAIRGVVLTGAGPKAFVAGADITEIAEMDAARAGEFGERGSRVFRDWELLHKPVVGAINGFALGGGCELAMACHMRLAAPNARFGQPEIKLGIIPGYGGTVRLPRLVGRGRALELLLTGGMIDAEEAARIGLVNRVVAADALLEQAQTLVRTIAQQSSQAVALCLAAVDATADLPLDEALAREAVYFGRACASDDRLEGTCAFLERRPPVFRGH